MTTKLTQTTLDSFFTAISADNANGVLPDKVQAFVQQYVINYRARNAAAPKTTATGGFVPKGKRRMEAGVSQATGKAKEEAEYGIGLFDAALGRG